MEPESEAEREARLAALEPLLRGAAHDVNNVIGVILGYVELARMGLGEEHEKAHRFLARALESVERAREIADGLLVAARPPMPADGPSEPGPPVAEACALLGRLLDARVRVEARVAEGVPVVPLGPHALQRLVLHLGSFAAEAMPDGGVLTVGLEAAQPGPSLPAGRYVALRLTAVGMDPRAEVRGEDPRVGACRGLVERHGGTLERAGEPGRGTVFTVWLPSALDAPADAAPAPAPPPRRDGAVLVVDADADARTVLRGFLEADGYAVHEAATAAEAERALADADVALLIADERLPDLTGRDLAWRLADRGGAPAMIVTGDGGALPRRARRLPKPYLLSDLARALREVLGNPAG